MACIHSFELFVHLHFHITRRPAPHNRNCPTPESWSRLASPALKAHLNQVALCIHSQLHSMPTEIHPLCLISSAVMVVKFIPSYLGSCVSLNERGFLISSKLISGRYRMPQAVLDGWWTFVIDI